MNHAPQFTPFADRILVQPIPEPDDAIAVPDDVKSKSQLGRVLAIGPGRRNEAGEILPMRTAVDDVVLFGKYAGTKFPAHPLVNITGEGDSELLIMSEEELFGTLPNSPLLSTAQ